MKREFFSWEIWKPWSLNFRKYLKVLTFPKIYHPTFSFALPRWKIIVRKIQYQKLFCFWCFCRIIFLSFSEQILRRLYNLLKVGYKFIYFIVISFNWGTTKSMLYHQSPQISPKNWLLRYLLKKVREFKDSNYINKQKIHYIVKYFYCKFFHLQIKIALLHRINSTQIVSFFVVFGEPFANIFCKIRISRSFLTQRSSKLISSVQSSYHDPLLLLLSLLEFSIIAWISSLFAWNWVDDCKRLFCSLRYFIREVRSQELGPDLRNSFKKLNKW